jgi:hypothetical protein
MSESESRSGCGKFGVGCGILVFILLLGVAGLIVFVVQKAPDIVGAALTGVVAELELPAEQEMQIVKRIESVREEYKAGNISKERIALLGQQLVNSPVFHCALFRLASNKYVAPSGLSEEEKAEANRTLERLARGVFEKKITGTDLDRAVSPLRDDDGDIREQISDEDLRAFMVLAKREVEKADIPDEEFNIDIAAEFNKTVDRILESNTDAETE